MAARDSSPSRRMDISPNSLRMDFITSSSAWLILFNAFSFMSFPFLQVVSHSAQFTYRVASANSATRSMWSISVRRGEPGSP